VLVVGTGVMGLLHLMTLRGREEPALLIAADRMPERMKAAERYADVVVDASVRALPDAVCDATHGEGVDVAVVGPGTVEALDAALASVAPGGTLLAFTPTPPDVRWPLPVHDAFFKDITITASYSAGPEDTREAFRLIREGLPVESLVTHRLPLAQAAAGYDLVRAAGAALKVLVTP
jgi:L-iditol 2-dehydrogenase